MPDNERLLLDGEAHMLVGLVPKLSRLPTQIGYTFTYLNFAGVQPHNHALVNINTHTYRAQKQPYVCLEIEWNWA